ncbi:MAG TPA: DUF4247 domain-containing protein [Micromonosporaceae bacterium]|nr:DUF4247 domain-containing protein [Micromonosporaceae bacterium]
MRHRKWFGFAAIVAVVGVLVAGFAVAYGNFSPRGYVENHYTRSASDDIGDDALAYTSKKMPSEVADELTDAWEPADEYIDGSGVYLRYADEAVVILPLAVGSLILLENLRTAYPRYAAVVGGFWGWGRGASLRGGGPGEGK